MMGWTGQALKLVLTLKVLIWFINFLVARLRHFALAFILECQALPIIKGKSIFV